MNSKLLAALRALALLVLLGQSPWLAAYNLTPIYEETEDRLDGTGTAVPPFLRPLAANVLTNFSDPVHEALTALMFDCKTPFENCGDNPETVVPNGVLDGLRWNDNPIFRITTKSLLCRDTAGRPIGVLDLDTAPVCWLTLFYDAEKRASATPGEHFSGAADSTPVALIYRIHFGDLQFIHGMGSWDGERADLTQQRLLAWIEFTYKVHDGELQNLDAPIAREIPALREVFGSNGFSARSLFNPQTGYASAANDANVRNMALGSLIHALEDSYSAAHADRETSSAGRSCAGFPDAPVPGRIRMFYAYNHQDSNKHKERDAAPRAQAQLEEKGSVVEVGRQLLAFIRQGKPWAEVAPYAACVMELADASAVAGPGPFAK